MSRYVALGSSMAAGPGIRPPADGAPFRAGRSARNYPHLVAEQLGLDLVDVTYSGASTANVLTDPQNGAPPQVDALDGSEDLVTVTIGGNDVGFADIMITCSLSTTRACVNAVNRGIHSAKTALPARLDATYATIRGRAPHATVVVLGYPRIVEPGGSCLNATKIGAINRGADALDAVIADRAAAAGVRYVDPRARFAGHGACAAQPWINPFTTVRLVESFHPNATGYARGYLPLLTAVTG